MVASSIPPGGFTTGPRTPNGTRTTKTTTREFDEQDRCVKETVTEVTETTYGYSPWYTTTYSSHTPTIRNAALYDQATTMVNTASVDTSVKPTTLHSSKRARQQQKDVDI